MTGRSASKSPAPSARRSSRHSTPTRTVTSPGPSSRSTRSSGAHLLEPIAGTPSLAALVPTPTSISSSSSGLAVPKSPSMRALSPRAVARSQRPALPLKHINRLMNPVGGTETASPNPKEKKTHRVKTQILDLGDDNGQIGIARVKVPVPKGVPGCVITFITQHAGREEVEGKSREQRCLFHHERTKRWRWFRRIYRHTDELRLTDADECFPRTDTSSSDSTPTPFQPHLCFELLSLTLLNKTNK